MHNGTNVLINAHIVLLVHYRAYEKTNLIENMDDTCKVIIKLNFQSYRDIHLSLKSRACVRHYIQVWVWCTIFNHTYEMNIK